MARPSGEQGRRKGSVRLGVRTATGHEGLRKGSGLRETGDGEAHRWLFLFRTLNRYIIILLLLLLLLSLLLFFREKKNNPPIIPEGSHFWMGAKMDCGHLKIQRLAGYHLARAEWGPPGAELRAWSSAERRWWARRDRGRRGGAGRAAVFVMV